MVRLSTTRRCGWDSHLQRRRGSADNNIIRNNRIHDITRDRTSGQVWGIIVVGNNNQIYNNLIYRVSVGPGSSPGGDGIAALKGSRQQAFGTTLLPTTREWAIYVDRRRRPRRSSAISSPQQRRRITWMEQRHVQSTITTLFGVRQYRSSPAGRGRPHAADRSVRR